MKIFIVEDSPEVLERLAEMVREVGDLELVGSAASYDAAVTGIVSTRPDVAIFDVKLADNRGTGIDVLGRVKRNLPGIRAIVLTNDATPQHLKASADAGAEYYLDKSVDADRISEILAQMKNDLAAR